MTDHKNRNGSCTSPTSALVSNRSSRAAREDGSSGIGSRSDYSGSSTSLSGGTGGTGAGPGSGAPASGASSGAPVRTRPDCVRRSKSQGTSSHHRYRDRLVRTLAFNSSCPVSTREEDAVSFVGQPMPSSATDPAEQQNNGKADGSRDESPGPPPPPPPVAARRNLLLLHHRHQSAYTSFGINVTWHTQTRCELKRSIPNKQPPYRLSLEILVVSFVLFSLFTRKDGQRFPVVNQHIRNSHWEWLSISNISFRYGLVLTELGLVHRPEPCASAPALEPIFRCA